jgi:hypothetical protein
MIFVLIRPSFHLIESQSSRTHNLYYYNVAVLNLNSPPLPSFHHNTSEVIVAIDLLCKTTIWCSSGVARNDPMAALCWIRLFLRAHNQSVVRTSWKLAEFSRELRSLHTCNLGAVWVLFFPWPELWFDVHMELHRLWTATHLVAERSIRDHELSRPVCASLFFFLFFSQKKPGHIHI